MANETILYDDGTHKCVMFSFDDEEQEERYLSVNQFLVVQKDSAIVIDPGSEASVYDVQDAIARHIALEKVKYVFFSHQDPDVAGSIAQWCVSTQAKLVISALWTRFLGHYGLMDMSRLVALGDAGARISFGEEYLQFVPAHFLHSPGNFTVYDSRSKILFSGDIGAAVMPPMQAYKEVEDFDAHLAYLEGFHKRYMASNRFCRAWVAQVRRYDVQTIAPQHGAVFTGENVGRFLDWLEALECLGDNPEALYTGH